MVWRAPQKYYEDMGYPGHKNCSDNFNAALASYPIAPRRGWTAMNLFFNTFFDARHHYCADEPWSRPGDYVMLRATRDLVCVSSACPDDIDAANGWNPTDIQVRVYGKKETFQRAISHRPPTNEPGANSHPVMTKETGFHSETQKLTRNFTEYANYWLPNDFTNQGAVAEYWACRRSAAMIDLSPLRKYEVTGPDALALLQHCVTRDVKKLSDGGVVYTAMCNESGGMIDDGTIFRLGQNNFRWIGGSDESGLWLRACAAKLKLRAWVKGATDQLHNLQVQGPKSRDILREIIWTRADQPQVAELKWFRFSIARLHSETGAALIVSRTGYTGELGYEIFCHPDDAAEVWRAVARAGGDAIKPMGLAALDMLRIEAGLIFAGYEFCEQTDPFEAGIGFCVPRDKTCDFVGRDALARRRENPAAKTRRLGSRRRRTRRARRFNFCRAARSRRHHQRDFVAGAGKKHRARAPACGIRRRRRELGNRQTGRRTKTPPCNHHRIPALRPKKGKSAGVMNMPDAHHNAPQADADRKAPSPPSKTKKVFAGVWRGIKFFGVAVKVLYKVIIGFIQHIFMLLSIVFMLAVVYVFVKFVWPVIQFVSKFI